MSDEHDRAELERLRAENETLRGDLARQKKIATRSLASYQQRALQMEIIRQQNEDLDRLAADLAKAKRIAEDRAREVQKSSELKTQFLANFSHEIRTPLNGIIGYCDLLSREEGSRLTAHGRRDLRTVRRNAKTLLALINDILDLSKIEAGQVEVITEAVDLEGIAEDCTATVRTFLHGKEVELVTQIDDEAKGLFSDGLKIRQIVLNLLSNAAKFTDVGEVTLDARAKGKDLHLRVEDTGVGIASDDLPHIFEKFRQVDGSRTRTKGGTGLGLAIVHELIRLMGGTIEVKSIKGRGTTFDVWLPGVIGKPIEKRSSKPTSQMSSLGGGTFRVLVVDDDPMIQQLARRELEADGFGVITAEDGVQALRKARDESPDAILLDLRLPKLDGWKVLNALKSDERLRKIPVAILSVEEERAKAFTLGAFEYLVKPVEPQTLVEVVRRGVEPDGGGVLVVDDDADTRELVRRRLEDEGYSVREANDGRDALVQVRHDPPALMVLDLVMPEPDGFDVLERLRLAGHDFPVVVLTGKDLDASDMKRLRQGFARVIRKNGVSLQQVMEEVRERVRQRRSDRPPLPRVLYVEDVAQNRDIVRRYLAGFVELIEATDGEHGVEVARRERPDLVLMDLSLPRLDGWAAASQIRQIPELDGTPVLALTAHASPEDRLRAKEAGCVGYLTKPIERERLFAALKEHLRV